MKKLFLPLMIVVAAAILCNGEITVVPPSGSGTTDNTKVATNNGTAYNLTINGGQISTNPLTNNLATPSTMASYDSAGRLTNAVTGTSVSFSANTWNTIQDIRTTASPTFAGATLTGLLSSTSQTNNGYYVGKTIDVTYIGGTNLVIDWSLADYFNVLQTNNTWLILTNITKGRCGAIIIATNGTAYTFSYGAQSVSHILTNANITLQTNQTRLSCGSDYWGTNMVVVISTALQ